MIGNTGRGHQSPMFSSDGEYDIVRDGFKLGRLRVPFRLR